METKKVKVVSKKVGRPKGSKNKLRDEHGNLLSKSELIRKHKVTFPNAKPRDIAAKYGVASKFVNQVLWAWRKRNKDIPTITKLAEVRKKHVDEHMQLTHVATSNRTVKITKADMVNHPPHYKVGGMETIDFIEAKKLSYNLGNVLKYITRADHKGNQLEDLQKARWYLDREITRVTPPLP